MSGVVTADQLNVSRETFERLSVYAELLKKWNPKINLVSKSTIAGLWTRHIEDSLQVYRYGPKQQEHWADFGSGGGFPGLVAAICLAEENPHTKVTLVESDQRKSAFLRTVLRETNVKATVVSDRIEAVSPLGADVISARALANLSMLLGFAHQHLAEGGMCLFPKGISWEKEVEEARKQWFFDMEVSNSRTDAGAVVLRIKGLSHV